MQISNLIPFPVRNRPIVPKQKNSNYFHVPAQIAAHLGASSDLLLRAEYGRVSVGDLVLFYLNAYSPWSLGKMFKLGDDFFIREETGKNRLYPVLPGTLKILGQTEIPAKNAKEALGRLEISRLTVGELSSFSTKVLGRLEARNDKH